MSIELLNKAATAAGFAMATPEDEAEADTHAIEKEVAAESRALMLPQHAVHGGLADSIGRMTEWVKSYLPGMGWRAPA